MLAHRRGRKHHPQRQLRVLPLRLESPDRSKLRSRITLLSALMFEDNPLRPHHFDKPAFVRIVGAVRPVHRVPPNTARPHIRLMNRSRKSERPPPLHHLLRVPPRLPNQFPRRMHHPCDHNLPVCRILNETFSCFGHAFSPFVFSADIDPNGPAAAPKFRDTLPPTRPPPSAAPH